MALYNSTGELAERRPLGDCYGVGTDASGRVTSLHLGFNDLSGQIPPELGNLANQGWLDLSGNQLSGSVPEGLRGVLHDFYSLNLPYCTTGSAST